MPARKDDVVMSIDIAARPDVVRSFFADPAKFAQWFGQGAKVETERRSFRIPYPNGDVAVGELTSVDERRILFTWGYENSAHGLAPGASNVEVLLEPTALGTTVKLSHSGLASEDQRRNHEAGWRFYLAALANHAADAFQGPVSERAVDAYIAAWEATDGDERRRLLEKCFDETGLFKDRMGYADSRDALDAYIANAQRFMPGISMRRAGQLMRSHGNVLFQWSLVTQDGVTIGTGWNEGELNSSGQFRQMIGFNANNATSSSSAANADQ